MKNLTVKLLACWLITFFIPIFCMGQQIKITESKQDIFTKDYSIYVKYFIYNMRSEPDYFWSICSVNSNIGFGFGAHTIDKEDISVGDRLLISLANGTTLTFKSILKNNAEFNKNADKDVQNTNYYPNLFNGGIGSSSSTTTHVEGHSWYNSWSEYWVPYADIQKLAISPVVAIRIYFNGSQYRDAITDKTPAKEKRKIMKLAKKFLNEYDTRKKQYGF